MRLSIDRRVALTVAVMLLAAVLPIVFTAQAGAVSTTLVVNEIDYDQPGTDDAEYIELRNVSGANIDVTGWKLELVNGSNDSVYRTFTLSATISPGDYYVVCGIPANVANCDLDVIPDTNLIQNGSPDAVAIRDADGNLIDTISYEGDTGAPYTETSGIGLIDSSSFEDAGISRLPNGIDTDVNNADLGQSCITPGGANTADTPPCVSVPVLTIGEIQGAGHVSPYVGQTVETSGVVTAVAFDGYYIQDSGDGNNDTSDGMFVFMGSAPKPAVGEMLELTDVVSEFIPGGAGTGNLSITQMAFPMAVPDGTASLPAPIVIGTNGRVAPAVDVITRSERPVNLQNVPGVFNPDNDGIDFYESLEGMRVTIEDPVAVSATRTFNSFSSELFTLTNNGANIAPSDARTARGGINLQPDLDNDGDQNPERVQIQFDGTLYPFSVPAITVGDRMADVTGVMGYSFGNFEVNATEELTVHPSGLGDETTALDGSKKRATVASYNVLNLSPLPGDDNQRSTLASQITDNLGGPDVVALQEIQDNNGSVADYPDYEEDDPDNPGNDGTTDATLTLQALVDAIAAAGGPDYAFFDVAPADGTSGGVPGGNIRNAFLYNPDTVKLVDFESLNPDVLASYGVSNPDAFLGTRNPLLATFKLGGKEFTVINNHLSSRFGSTPVFGGPQPFVQAGEVERAAQTGALNEVTDALIAAGRGNKNNASKAGRVIVLGDLNTMEFTNELTDTLPGTGADRVLTNLIDGLTDDNVYTFNFEGNSQVLDHMFVTDNLLGEAEFDIVHTNVDFPRVDNTVGSDHEPLVASFQLK